MNLFDAINPARLADEIEALIRAGLCPVCEEAPVRPGEYVCRGCLKSVNREARNV